MTPAAYRHEPAFRTQDCAVLSFDMEGGHLTSRTDIVLPPRYDFYWRRPFDDAIQPHLTAGVRVLDIGSGRVPSIKPDRRPDGCQYVGLDISASELEAAGAMAYDETIAADVMQEVSALRGSFDLVISWQVLEHVRQLDRAAANIHGYLRPQGTFVSLLSGSFAFYAVINKLLPDRLGHAIVSRAMHRTPDETPVFPAHYDKCHPLGLRQAFGAFQHVSVMPFYRAATYLSFSRPLMRAYLAYENFVYRRGVEKLASHYLIVAGR